MLPSFFDENIVSKSRDKEKVYRRCIMRFDAHN